MSNVKSHSSRKVHRFKVISLDVWGHGPGEHDKYDCDGECDGYTVNDAHYTGTTIEVKARRYVYNAGTEREFIDYHATHRAIVRALHDAGMLTTATTEKHVDIDGEDDYTLFVNLDVTGDPEDGKPLLQLERVPDGE